MKIYFEEIPEHCFSPDVSVTIRFKKLKGAGLAEEIAQLIREKLDNREDVADFFNSKNQTVFKYEKK